MKIVIDTNVVISGTFFGGYPRKVIEAVADGTLNACATPEIVDEYEEIVEEMVDRKQGHIRKDILSPFIAELELIETKTKVEISRDPDDDKFIECAIDAKAMYIVSGDKDLLDIGEVNGIIIIKAADFCNLLYIPNYCPECMAKYRTEHPRPEQGKKIQRKCRACGRTFTFPSTVQHWPNYCRECRAKYRGKNA